MFQKLEAENTYKIVEVVGGYDRTEEFGSLIADGAAEVMNKRNFCYIFGWYHYHCS